MSGWFDAEGFRDLVTGRRRGAAAAALRAALRIVETPYAWAMNRRNRWYDAHPAAARRIAAPVVSVGNLTLGGTGKTPLVAWLARWFLARGLRVAIVSRGYKGRSGQPNDEAIELSQRLPGVPHVQNPDRVAAAAEAIERHAAQVVVLDDGFQHRRLARDLDIVLLDALDPFGGEHVFPRGLLREPLSGLRRADVVVLSRADAIAADARRELRARVEALAPDALWLEAAHAPRALLAADGREEPIATLAGRPVAAFCGIGNPAGFRHTLSACGLQLAAFRAFADHCPFDARPLAELGDWLAREAAAAAPAAVVCTQKDLVKLNRSELAGLPLWALAVETAFLGETSPLEQRLKKLL